MAGFSFWRCKNRSDAAAWCHLEIQNLTSVLAQHAADSLPGNILRGHPHLMKLMKRAFAVLRRCEIKSTTVM